MIEDFNSIKGSILGSWEFMAPGKDAVDGKEGRDILFGDRLVNNIGDNNLDASKELTQIIGDKGINIREENADLDDIREKLAALDEDSSNERDGNAQLFGGHGDDILYGGGGNDFLNGGTGDDVLISALGDDILVGGDGSDIIWI